MKRLLLIITAMAALNSSTVAQGDADFTRKGKWLIETGTGTLGLQGNPTGSSFLFPEDGSSLGVISLEGGKFISENFAWTGKLTYLIGGSDFNITTVAAGAKYYVNGNIPIKVNAGAGIFGGTFGSDDPELVVNASLGYAAKLADNILVEPQAGIFYAGGVAITAGFSFSLIL